MGKRKQPCCVCGHWFENYWNRPDTIIISLDFEKFESPFICQGCYRTNYRMLKRREKPNENKDQIQEKEKTNNIIDPEWKTNVTPQQVVVASLMSGLFYSQYSMVFSLLGIEIVSETQFNRICRDYGNDIQYLLDQALDFNRQSSNLKELKIALDGGWSHRGWKARESSTIFFDVDQNSIFDVIHVTRRQGYKGFSNQMEKEAVNRFGQKWKDKITLHTLIHDNCKNIKSVVQGYWPKVQEQLDVSHYGKNIRKKIEKSGKKFHSLEGKGQSVKNWFRSSIESSNGDVKRFNELMQLGVNHYENKNHDHCSQCKQKKQNPNYWISDPNEQKEFERHIENIIKDSDKIIGGYNTNSCESFFSSKTKYIPKRINAPSQYEFRVNMAVLDRECPAWRELLSEQWGWKIPEVFYNIQKRKDQKKQHKQNSQKLQKNKKNNQK
ncbi:hypothetical protein M0811_00361 [Anaeramoeba ignava]|uniref:Uncharacterized protein n=1 Tax=Anaeramoeba ignava TaxID=1746090 RepID=A0A9Q0LQU5_ANAIG|nr:hypothetical protein M0811_00361 [Anaeramoeba ignava]